MREIKFRGKAVNGSGWVYGMPNYQMTHIFNDSQVDSVDNYEVIPETIGQFVGLKDKNGIEIYEGDILLLRDYPISHHRIYYDSDLCCFSDYRIEDGDCNTNYYGFDFVKDCEVIDNIHDNPELLTQN